MFAALVCMVNDPFDPPGLAWIGGGQLVFAHLGRFLVANNIKIAFVTRKTGVNKPECEVLGPLASVFRLPVGPAKMLSPGDVGRYAAELADATIQLFEEKLNDVDLIHSQYWLGGMCARAVTAGTTRRHVHNILSLGRVRRECGERTYIADEIRDHNEVDIFCNADWLIAQCLSEAQDLLRLYPEITHHRLTVINHGADAELFAPRPESRSDYIYRTAPGLAKGDANPT